jgi:divalent metal cation (Fe/Co/Zn/Cd) transporter
MAAVRVSGVRGVHNILVSKISGTNYVGVSLHVQVNRSATLTEAHGIANAVEDSIKRQMKGVENITVHLEPLMPAIGGVEPVADSAMQGAIKEIVMAAGEIKQVSRVATYRTADNILKIDVDCVFEGAKSIEQIHELASEIEKRIRAKYPGSIVTIHEEPS